MKLIKLVGLEELKKKKNRSVNTNRTRVEEVGIVETEIAGVVEATYKKRKSR